MGRMVMYGGLVIGSFALAAGGSWFMSQKEEDKTEQTEGEAEEGVEQLGEQTPEGTPQVLPSAVPPKSMSAEDMIRIAAVMKDREDAIKRREAELESDERRLKLVLMDIEAEQQETDGFLMQVRGTLDTTTGILNQIIEAETRPAPIEPEKKEEPEDEMQLPDAVKIKSIKKVATMYQAMDPAAAAKQLAEMADDGDVEQVVWIVSQFDEKKAGKMLEVMADPKLAIEIARRSLKIRYPEKKKKGR
jgi:flagellar motility protein MotE (MotC chaperone)